MHLPRNNIFFIVIIILTICIICNERKISAEVLNVKTIPGSFDTILAKAKPGDTLKLESGFHQGPILIDKSVTIIGEPNAIIDGQKKENTITITAPDVVLRGLKIINSGQNLSKQHSGIFVDKNAHRVVIENNFLENNLISIYLWGPKDGLVRNNRVYGLSNLRLNERGNGIQLWRSHGSIVEKNEIRYGRDGIYVTTSKNNIFRNNTFEKTRFAIHYMYTNDSKIIGNISRGNHIGYALMYSNGLSILDNKSINDRDHGIALNYNNESVLEHNLIYNNANKCIFIYNSNKNTFRYNHFEGCAIGVHFTAGSERNNIYENNFIDNINQVKYVGTRHLNWSKNNKGNYWSDNPAFDLDRNGISDTAYRPNDMIDHVMWKYPSSKLLLNAPAVQMLRWAQSTFPAIYPGGVYDSAPLMIPVALNEKKK